MPKKLLPTFQGFISPIKQSNLVVDCVAIVDKPAIEATFTAFGKDIEPQERLKFSKVDEAQRIVAGPAMIPDLLIYRNNKDMGECQVFFTKETIECIAERFYAEGYHTNCNEMHNPDMAVDGLTFFMSFIRNEEKGLIGMAGDYPDGTWFLGAKVNDETLWQKVVDGTYSGFSVEGLFQYKQEVKKSDEELLKEIEQLATEDTEEAYNKIAELLKD